jgi:hypothetical protein
VNEPDALNETRTTIEREGASTAAAYLVTVPKCRDRTRRVRRYEPVELSGRDRILELRSRPQAAGLWNTKLRATP